MRALLLLVPISFALGAAADGCAPSSSPASLDVAGTLYVADDCAGVDASPPNDHCLAPWGGKWVYRESNGLAGLQRGDEVVDDTCGGQVAADTLVV